MNIRIALLALVCLMLAAVPSMAQGNVYDNGPVNGQVDATTINFGFVTTDSFTVANNNGNIGGMNFWAWVEPGDTATSVEVQIGNQEFGNNLLDMTVALTQSGCFVNGFGFDVCLESSTFNGPNLANGNYWVSLGNATTIQGNPLYWDENSGVGCMSQGCPSQATCSGCISPGNIPSEAFTLTAQGSGTTPEPGSIWLFGAGLLAVVGRLRRELF